MIGWSFHNFHPIVSSHLFLHRKDRIVKSRSKGILKELKYVFLVVPTLTIWFTLNIFPQLGVYRLAFFKWNGFSKIQTFVGWQNFQTVFNDPYTIRYISNTLLYILFLFTIQTFLAISFALILKRNTIPNRMFRTFFFLPMVFSSVMVGLTWGYMYDANLGILNNLFVAAGNKGFAGFDWLGQPSRAVYFIVMVHIWANIGFPLTILTAGLHTIPETLYEAATIDGATANQSFWGITIPLLLPTLLRISLLTLTTGAMAFDYIQIFGASASSDIRNPFDTIAVITYRTTQRATNFGISAVYSVFLALILLVFFAAQYFAQKKAEENAGGGK